MLIKILGSTEAVSIVNKFASNWPRISEIIFVLGELTRSVMNV